MQGLVRRRGIVVILSDFYESPAELIRAIEPLRIRGNEVVLFHILDPQEMRRELGGSTVLVDLETRRRIEVTPEYAAKEYGETYLPGTSSVLRESAQRAGMSYQLLPTDRPLDDALREYLTLRQGRQ